MRRAEAGIQVDKFYPPTDWLDNNNKQIDIRKNAENNSIVLLVGHSADFIKYSLLGLLANTSAGTYDVYIDDVLVGSGITKNTQYDIDFSTINTSYGSATTPEALVLHKVVVKPTTSGATITTFRCARTSGVTTVQQQGVLWCHFELDNQINISGLFGEGYPYNKRNQRIIALTSKGDYINNTTATESIFTYASIFYIPKLENGATSLGYYLCTNLKRLRANNQNINQTYQFSNCSALEQINIKNKNTSSRSIQTQQMYICNKLKILPFNKGFGGTTGQYWLHRIVDLYPTKIDVSSATGLLKVDVNGSSDNQMRGLRGLKVSNEAPFTGSSPQINVSYTGLDRDALVELFQSLPTVTGGQTLNCVACSGNNLTKVGSPTIDENGVASGFSGSNRFTLPRVEANTYNRIEIKTKIITGETLQASNIVGDDTYYGMGILISSDGRLEMQVNFSNYDRVFSDVIVEPNTEYTITGIADVPSRTLSITVNDVTNNHTLQYYTTIRQLDYKIGYGTRNGTFNGSIYLEDTSIKIDRNYLMKGYLLDADKAIATDKGWGLVLS